MYQIHDDTNASAVCVVHERFEFFGCTKSAGGGKEVGHVVSETAVVWVLLDRHDLDAVVSQISNTREYVDAEVLVGIDFLFLAGHANMALIDEKTGFAVFGHLLGVAPLVFAFPDLCRKEFCLVVLYHSGSVTGDAFSPSAVPLDEEFEQLSMFHGGFGQFHLPVAESHRLQTIAFVLFPSVHITLDINGGGVRRPLPEDPSLLGAMESEIEVPACPFFEFESVGEFELLAHCVVVATLNSIFVWRQIRIVLHQFELFAEVSHFIC